MSAVDWNRLSSKLFGSRVRAVCAILMLFRGGAFGNTREKINPNDLESILILSDQGWSFRIVKDGSTRISAGVSISCSATGPRGSISLSEVYMELAEQLREGEQPAGSAVVALIMQDRNRFLMHASNNEILRNVMKKIAAKSTPDSGGELRLALSNGPPLLGVTNLIFADELEAMPPIKTGHKSEGPGAGPPPARAAGGEMGPLPESAIASGPVSAGNSALNHGFQYGWLVIPAGIAAAFLLIKGVRRRFLE